MKNILTIFNREIKSFFNSPIAYIFIIVFLLLSMGIFMTQFFIIGNSDLRGFFLLLPLILCVFIPAITMRLWSEDKRGNTLELLLTFPIKTHELVLGKFLASLAFFIAAIVSTFTVVIMVIALGSPDIGAIFCQYLGTVFLASFFLSIGIFVSGFCKDQIVSFIVSMMACFAFFLIGADFSVTSIDGWIPGMGSFLRDSFGMIQHFASFQRGIIDLRDILYFIVGTALFLTLNGFWLENRMRPKANSIFTTTCAISLGIFMLANFIFSDMPIGRFDLTDGRIHKISKESGVILKELKAPVTVKLYISPSDKMPSQMKSLERDIRDRLDELKIVAKGKFQYKVFHMEAAQVGSQQQASLEETAEKKGIRPFQVSSIEADEVGVKLIYSALSIAYKEKKEEVIPRVMPQDVFGLEYSIISKIYRMTLEKTPRIAVVAPYKEKPIDPQMKQFLMMMGQNRMDKYRDDNYSTVSKLLEYEGYRISRIRLNKAEPIPDDANALVIIEPENLNDRQRYEINKFLVNGGSVFLAAQQYDYVYESVRHGFNVRPKRKTPGINELIKGWGLGISGNFLMDTQSDVINISGQSVMGIIQLSSPVKLPIHIKVISDQMNKNMSITSRINTILYLWGSALDVDSQKIGSLGLEVKELFTSSKDAWDIPFHEGYLNQEDISPPPMDKRKVFPFALFVKGQFVNRFEGEFAPLWPEDTPKEGAEAPEEPPEKEKIELNPAPGKLIIVGCSKMFGNELFGNGGHASFFLNSIDALSLSERLVKIRGKSIVNRAIRKISSGAKIMWKAFIMFFIPVLLCVIGGVRIFLRKRSKGLYLKSV